MAPYRDAKNTFSAANNSTEDIMVQPGEKEFSIDNLKLTSYKIPQATTGGTIEIVENNCLVPRYFLSKSSNVVLNHRDAIGGFFDLTFMDKNHNFTAQKNAMSNSALNSGSTIDVTQEIRDFKVLADVQADFYIYFFCPFIKKESTSSIFKLKFNLNSDEYGSNITTQTQDELENAVISANTGTTVNTSTSNEVKTLRVTWDDVLAQVKSSAQSGNTSTKMSDSVDGYYSIIERSLDVKVGTDDAPQVEMVTVLPPKGAIELIKLNSGNTKYYLRSNSEVTGFYFNPGATDGIVSFSNKMLNETLEFDATQENYTVMVLLYSVKNADNMSELQGTLARVVTSSDRLLQTAYDGTTLYLSAYEMDDEYQVSPGLEWYWILLIILAALIALILLILLIVFCCCQKSDSTPGNSLQNTQTNSQSYYQDTFMKPGIKDKDSKSQVGYMTQQTTEQSGFTNDL